MGKPIELGHEKSSDTNKDEELACEPKANKKTNEKDIERPD